jgi:hypothetical protein
MSRCFLLNACSSALFTSPRFQTLGIPASMWSEERHGSIIQRKRSLWRSCIRLTGNFYPDALPAAFEQCDDDMISWDALRLEELLIKVAFHDRSEAGVVVRHLLSH